ncbi:MAG TPA: FAD-binding oxidoreductase, partial [Chryseolinea sp.]|nr:FAD-binding oxidoreductase [Chryseolinea sp.]
MEELLSYQLTDQVKGQVIYPENPGYDQARKIWNGLFNKRPAMIVQCLSVEDVITTVNFARKNNMLVAIKGGGHNSAGTGSCDSGVMIDLSLLKKISINEKAMTVKVQGGCLWGEVDAALQQFGLAVPCGIISHTGVAGLTLGGGFGWISRKYGLTVDNLLSVEIVTADGRIVYANNSENQDLFWAVRGGGGNFGVVTEFEFSCAKIGTEVYSGAIVKKFEDLKAYVRFHREYVRKLPDEMTAWMVIRHAPPVPFIP